MPYIPSLLEYNYLDLKNKLNLINNNLKQFLLFQNSKDDKIYLHLDFVLSEFAQLKNVKPSNFIPELFSVLEQYFVKEEVYLSIHLMGLEKDLEFAYQFLNRMFSRFVLEKPKWSGVIFVPLQSKQVFESISKLSNFKIGVWYDYDQWDKNLNFENNSHNLLMTVFAGKSGQVLDQETKLDAYKISKTFKRANFTFDGGWAVRDELKKNVQIVSYSDFWQEFDKIAKIK